MTDRPSLGFYLFAIALAVVAWVATLTAVAMILRGLEIARGVFW